jgi:hypothetical protein
VGEWSADHADGRPADVSGHDGPGVEYAYLPADSARVGGEAFRSLAAWLNVSVEKVIELRDRGELAGAIEHRNASRTTDPRVALRHIERRAIPA